MSTPLFISVVIPTRNRAQLLADTVASLRAQNYPKASFEIIVVDDGSTEDIESVVKKFQDGIHPLVRYVRQPPRGLNAARNNGITQAKADYIIFTDDDVDVPPEFLAAHAEAERTHPQAAAFGGPVLPRYEGDHLPCICGQCGTLEELEAYDRGAADKEVPWVIGANLAVRRTTLQKVGPFNENLACWQGDETEWLLRVQRAGLPVMYVARAKLWHRRPADDVRRMMVKRKYLKSKGGVWYARETGGKLPSPTSALKEVARWTLHMVRRRCFIGFVRAAINWGRFMGWLKWVWLRRPTVPQHKATP